jgi:PKD repeat protein
VGAYELRPHVPIVHASASQSKVAAGKPIKFQATGSDASPGDALSFRWDFGGGSSASGAIVTHAFKSSGKHKVSVTVTDLDRFTATQTITVTVS